MKKRYTEEQIIKAIKRHDPFVLGQGIFVKTSTFLFKMFGMAGQ